MIINSLRLHVYIYRWNTLGKKTVLNFMTCLFGVCNTDILYEMTHSSGIMPKHYMNQLRQHKGEPSLWS